MYELLRKGDKVGIIACSDGVGFEGRNQINDLKLQLENLDLKIVLADTIYKGQNLFSGTPLRRAEQLNSFFRNKEIKMIFDPSGGDSANQILEFIDWKLVSSNPKLYFGMSDLSVIINSIYTMTNNSACHFYINNILKSQNNYFHELFYNSMFQGKSDLFDFQYEYIKGKNLSGVVVGGNLRCFLKLCGTKFFPNPEGKILLLESLGGNETRIASLFYQLRQIGYLNKINGVILGDFRQMKNENISPSVEELILEVTDDIDIPIIKTSEIGHVNNGKAIMIGEKRIF